MAILHGLDGTLWGPGAMLCIIWTGPKIGCATWTTFGTVLGSQRGAQGTPRRPLETPRWPKRAPKGSPRRPKINHKMQSKIDTLLGRLWSRLGTVLGRSWACLGVSFGRFLLEIVMFRENRPFRKNVASRRVLGRSWPDLGRQKGLQEEAFGDLSWGKKVLRCRLGRS